MRIANFSSISIMAYLFLTYLTEPQHVLTVVVLLHLSEIEPIPKKAG